MPPFYNSTPRRRITSRPLLADGCALRSPNRVASDSDELHDAVVRVIRDKEVATPIDHQPLWLDELRARQRLALTARQVDPEQCVDRGGQVDHQQIAL